MCPLVRSKVPFEYCSKDDFPAMLAHWIGHVFYDILPGEGYEIREDQIFTAFQIANAVCKGKVHFAEAGLGTGKTFAYLLSAIPYARFSGKPVIIACASTALQEQLTGPKGDINTLARLLDLDLDVRMAKDPRQFICDLKVNRVIDPFTGESSRLLGEIVHWADETDRGERSEVPHIPDRVWSQVAWDETMPCTICSSRGFCKLVRARNYYRSARDLIVCDHGLFFDDLWEREERIAEGKLTLLPDYSAVIIDEGHKILLPAAMRAGRQIAEDDLNSMISLLERLQGARTSLLAAAISLRTATSRFFKILFNSVLEDERTERLAVRVSNDLLRAADTLLRALKGLHHELQNEQELYTGSLSTTRLQSFEAKIERATAVLDRFCRDGDKDAIVWVDRKEKNFWVVPRNISGLLRKFLFIKKLPVVFSSATLSIGGDFSYFTRTLGLQKPSSSSVDSSFDFAKQVLIYLPRLFSTSGRENWFDLALERLVALLRLADGRALVLANSPSDVRRIRRGLKNYRFPFEIFWEDRAERGYLVDSFREEVSSVLVGAGFREGIDVPGAALSLLVIWRLPFPAQDPLIEARRREAKEQGLNPLTEVDYPEMGLRLKQGCGRLIRKQDDRGVIAILEPVMGTPWEHIVMDAIPAGAQVTEAFESLSLILKN